MVFHFSNSDMACEFAFTNDPSVLLENLRVVPQNTCSEEKTISV